MNTWVLPTQLETLLSALVAPPAFSLVSVLSVPAKGCHYPEGCHSCPYLSLYSTMSTRVRKHYCFVLRGFDVYIMKPVHSAFLSLLL